MYGHIGEMAFRNGHLGKVDFGFWVYYQTEIHVLGGSAGLS